MTPPHMSTAYLLSSELRTARATFDVYSGTIESLPGILDSLLRLPYFVDHPADPETV